MTRDRSDPPLWLYVFAVVVVGAATGLLFYWGAPRVLTLPFTAGLGLLSGWTIATCIHRIIAARRA